MFYRMHPNTLNKFLREIMLFTLAKIDEIEKTANTLHLHLLAVFSLCRKHEILRNTRMQVEKLIKSV